MIEEEVVEEEESEEMKQMRLMMGFETFRTTSHYVRITYKMCLVV